MHQGGGGMVLNVRGRGYLAGIGSLNLPDELAVKIQDELGEDVARMLNAALESLKQPVEGPTDEEIEKEAFARWPRLGVDAAYKLKEWRQDARTHFVLACRWYRSRINTVEKKEAWISVKDRLPDINVLVWGYTTKKRICQTWVDKGTMKLDTYYLDVEKKEKFTHWQPLPSPPETKQ